MPDRLFHMSDEEIQRLGDHVGDELYGYFSDLVREKFPDGRPDRYASTMEDIGRRVLKLALDKYY